MTDPATYRFRRHLQHVGNLIDRQVFTIGGPCPVETIALEIGGANAPGISLLAFDSRHEWPVSLFYCHNR
ncbi:hypothetical protein YTPLAS18_17970 [Nitrospira sp.]|nr:hypothetical protein YTPLAS18_17970 [Nitrospira sp.]